MAADPFLLGIATGIVGGHPLIPGTDVQTAQQVAAAMQRVLGRKWQCVDGSSVKAWIIEQPSTPAAGACLPHSANRSAKNWDTSRDTPLRDRAAEHFASGACPGEPALQYVSPEASRAGHVLGAGFAIVAPHRQQHRSDAIVVLDSKTPPALLAALQMREFHQQPVLVTTGCGRWFSVSRIIDATGHLQGALPIPVAEQQLPDSIQSHVACLLQSMAWQAHRRWQGMSGSVATNAGVHYADFMRVACHSSNIRPLAAVLAAMTPARRRLLLRFAWTVADLAGKAVPTHAEVSVVADAVHPCATAQSAREKGDL
ncbi:hypothetical protein ACFPVT_07150 [Corynebacterium choanae]|uniref:hypothetical protein n=1 Tax=Corynebacterium choanae TaxID=1862358 RepID=UPI000F50DDDA|nr:hypothetical protein [Corynebacterium choanae]